ncbi:hypothetical protein ACFL1N_10610 [Thermodesulfobacteriota bacterium]
MFDTKRGTTLLHQDWPEAKWNISGLFQNRLLIRILVSTMEHENISHVLDSIQGSPDLLWNGGYPNANVPNPPDSPKFFKQLNDRGIGAFLDFSNSLIEEKHLSEVNSNRLLETLDEESGLNGVIVASDLLSDHIRMKKPGLKQICSIIKNFTENPDGNIEWYIKMQERFDRVAIHPDHVFDPDLLDKLDRDKAEILVNDECLYKCPNRKRHQTLNSRYNITGSKDILNEIGKLRQTSCAGGIGVLSEKKNPEHLRSCYMKQKELKTIYDMGFRNFKIEGRRMTMNSLGWNVINFIINPALSAPYSAILAHKIDQNIRQEFQKMAQKEDAL